MEPLFSPSIGLGPRLQAQERAIKEQTANGMAIYPKKVVGCSFSTYDVQRGSCHSEITQWALYEHSVCRLAWSLQVVGTGPGLTHHWRLLVEMDGGPRWAFKLTT